MTSYRRRDHVASTLIRCHFYVMCPLACDQDITYNRIPIFSRTLIKNKNKIQVVLVFIILTFNWLHGVAQVYRTAKFRDENLLCHCDHQRSVFTSNVLTFLLQRPSQITQFLQYPKNKSLTKKICIVSTLFSFF